MPRTPSIQNRQPIFKGKGAKLSLAVLMVLAERGPQTIYAIHKALSQTRGFSKLGYPSVNRKVKALEKMGYVKKAHKNKTKRRISTIYRLTAKGELGILLHLNSPHEVFTKIGEASARQILHALEKSGFKLLKP